MIKKIARWVLKSELAGLEEKVKVQKYSVDRLTERLAEYQEKFREKCELIEKGKKGAWWER